MPQNGHRPFNIIVLVQKRKKLTALEKNPLQSKKQNKKKTPVHLNYLLHLVRRPADTM